MAQMRCRRLLLSESLSPDLWFLDDSFLHSNREQMQNARENPLAAAAAAAAVSGAPPPQANAENLLDIEFDGAAPASAQKSPASGLSGLEGLAGTPQRIASPSVADMPSASLAGAGNLDDLMGLSNGMGQANGNHNDVLSSFAGLDMTATSQPPPAQQQLADGAKKTSQDLLDLF